jgi:hypothetical protein
VRCWEYAIPCSELYGCSRLSNAAHLTQTILQKHNAGQMSSINAVESIPGQSKKCMVMLSL